MNLLVIFILFFFLIAITAKIITITHEIGHAIPGLIFSKGIVTVYIGSYGEENESLKLIIGRLHFWIRYNVFKWKGGLCKLTDVDISLNKQLIFILMGPILPFFLGLAISFSSIYLDWHGGIKLASSIFLGVAIFGLYASLVPSKNSVETVDGELLQNDGSAFRKILRLKRLPLAVQNAVMLFYTKKYAEAGAIFSSIILRDFREPELFKFAISSHIMVKNFTEAKIISDEFQSLFQFDADDFSNAGLIYSSLELYEMAIDFYKRSLESEPNHKYTLNNFGYVLNNIKEYHSAILLFNRAIKIDPLFAYPYNNRGLSKILLGDYEAGVTDINYSLSLEGLNAYAIRNKGIYYMRSKNYLEALNLFEKAKDIDETTPHVDSYIAMAKLEMLS
ncbi:tetratricopeptide repeat protein [Pedobacter frigidisoli]|uniref:Tetratricopeptide repeat protein n=1 Tax=Pedobacter frigidisoli TaxID=2530455 RepID=A0A4R0P3Z9_9SPHI|nr:tetratricopeptide repeat protein [Pedobacter frigidisoli]TCD11585.1 tetratricopeptide repeat protein [Pedobacter frigidisoli]